MSCSKADISWCDFTLTGLVRAVSSISGSQTHFSRSPSTNRNTVQRKKLSFSAFVLFLKQFDGRVLVLYRFVRPAENGGGFCDCLVSRSLVNRISPVCRLLEVHQYVWQRQNKRVFLISLSGLRGMALYGRQLSVSHGVTFAEGRTDEASQLKLCRKQTFERVIDSL